MLFYLAFYIAIPDFFIDLHFYFLYEIANINSIYYIIMKIYNIM